MSDLGIDGLQEHAPKPRHTHVRGCLAVLVASAIIVGIGAFAYVKGVALIKDALSGPADYAGNGHGTAVVQVKKGDTAVDIGTTLLKAHVVKSQQAFVDAARADARSLTIQVGFYKMHKQMAAKDALDLMLDPKSKVTNLLTIPEGYRAKEILATIAAKTPLTSAELNQAFRDTAALQLPAYAGGDAEGYLFPATYNVAPNATAPGLLAAMTARFKQEAARDNLVSGASALHMSPHTVVIVASLVQAEARRPQDMPKVARVVYNRLKIGMSLQFDSTLHYAVDSRGQIATSNNLRQLNSPYNTYTRTGLPPTAIDSPGAIALHAALHPAAGNWRYFVTVNLRTGDTRFAVTFAQQQRNEALYYAYCQTSNAC
ncbi:MAG: endolytic transglycosylase MltG [Nocardioidaceae bacterium]